MRYIVKSPDPPASIREWLAVQLPVGLNLDYRNFNAKPELRRELIVEQYGLCAYTGRRLMSGWSGIMTPILCFKHTSSTSSREACAKRS